MPKTYPTACLLALGVLLGTTLARGAESGRYVAVYRDGFVAYSSAIGAPSWHEPRPEGQRTNQVQFGHEGEPLLYRDRSVRPHLRPPYIEFANGDVITGAVTGFDPMASDYGHRAVLLVAAQSPLTAYGNKPLAVRADRVSRIVTTAHPLAGESTSRVLLTDGRLLDAKSIRFSESGLTLLTEGGVERVGFSQIADLPLHVDRTAALLEDCLLASSMRNTRLTRLTTREGVVLTGTRINQLIVHDRRRLEESNEQGRSTELVLQPSWALDPVAVSNSSVCQSSFRSPNELPLSLLPAQSLAQRGVIGAALPWQRNASVHTAPLATQTMEADLGLGVHAHSEVAFDLPAAARELSLWVGLDKRAGPGGCVVCRIRREHSAGEVLWESGFLRGQDPPAQVGPLNVSGLARIVLVTEMGHEGRPAGADPLDIRDDVAWLSPLVTIDPLAIRTHETIANVLHGLHDWEFAPDQLADLELSSVWNSFRARWDPVLRIPRQREVILTRKVVITPTSDVLELLTAAPTRLESHDLSLQVNGTTLPWHANRDRERLASRQPTRRSLRPVLRRNDDEDTQDDTLAYWWDLQAYRGQTVTLQLRLQADFLDVEYTWGALSLRGAVANLPADSNLPKPDVWLTEVEALERASHKDRGHPLPRAIPADRPQPLRLRGQQFAEGYGMMRNSSVSFAVQPEYRAFVALVGTCTETSGPFRVLLDGRPVWEAPSKNALEGGEWIEIPLPPDTEKLTLETGPDGGYHGYSAFANAGFLLH